jgi:hypothetical protein
VSDDFDRALSEAGLELVLAYTDFHRALVACARKHKLSPHVLFVFSLGKLVHASRRLMPTAETLRGIAASVGDHEAAEGRPGTVSMRVRENPDEPS